MHSHFIKANSISVGVDILQTIIIVQLKFSGMSKIRSLLCCSKGKVFHGFIAS